MISETQRALLGMDVEGKMEHDRENAHEFISRCVETWPTGILLASKLTARIVAWNLEKPPQNGVVRGSVLRTMEEVFAHILGEGTYRRFRGLEGWIGLRLK